MRKYIERGKAIDAAYNLIYWDEETRKEAVAAFEKIPAADVAEVGKIAKMMSDLFGCPCNSSPLDEEMFDYCGDDCQNDEYVCWSRVIKCRLSKEDENA